MKRDTVTLGIDLGTSAVKCVALAPDGAVAAFAQAAFPIIRDSPGQAEQHPAAWLTATASAIAAITRDLDADIAAIGLTGQLPTLVCLDGDEALRLAITWMDSRADEWAATVLDDALKQRIYERTGMPIDGRYLAPMVRYHHANSTGIGGILSAKDYLCFALTGQRVTDPSTAAGYGVYDFARRAWDRELCDIWQLDPALLPEIKRANSIAGPLSEAAAHRFGLMSGIPVHVGCADSVASAYAIAGLEEGVVCVTTGSSTIIMDSVRAPVPDRRRRYLLTPHALDGAFGREMDLLSTGSSHRWLSELFGWGDEEIDRRAAGSEPGARGLFFAPYLAGGEQGALWNHNLRGVLHGMTVQNTAGDIARAYLEGIHFEIRRCIDVLAETSPVRRIVVAGHAAEHKATLQMLADILGRPVAAYRGASPSAIGAAMLAAPQTSGSPLPMVENGLTPSPAAKEYDHLYRRYCALFPTIAEAVVLP